jgi:hypothetical protein
MRETKDAIFLIINSPRTKYARELIEQRVAAAVRDRRRPVLMARQEVPSIRAIAVTTKTAATAAIIVTTAGSHRRHRRRRTAL